MGSGEGAEQYWEEIGDASVAFRLFPLRFSFPFTLPFCIFSLFFIVRMARSRPAGLWSVIPGGAALICAAQRAAGAAAFHTGFERCPLRCEEQSREISNPGFFFSPPLIKNPPSSSKALLYEYLCHFFFISSMLRGRKGHDGQHFGFAGLGVPPPLVPADRRSLKLTQLGPFYTQIRAQTQRACPSR